MNTKTALEYLSNWKKLPAYRAEPRVDWLIALAIPGLVCERFQSECKLLLPEFPLRKGTIYKDKNKGNESYRVDYYCLLEDGRHVLIEVKTDMNSIDSAQLKRFRDAKALGMFHILKGLQQIYEGTKNKGYKQKYKNLINELEKAGIINNEFIIQGGIKNDIEIVYIQPKQTQHEDILVFGFDFICNILDQSQDEFIVEFSKLLRTWK